MAPGWLCQCFWLDGLVWLSITGVHGQVKIERLSAFLTEQLRQGCKLSDFLALSSSSQGVSTHPGHIVSQPILSSIKFVLPKDYDSRIEQSGL